MKLIFRICLFSSLLAIVNCVDPILIEGDRSETKIVIDGYFTTQRQFNTVRISSSADFSNNYPNVPFNAPVSGASVSVYENNGPLVAQYSETSPGVHNTDAEGIVGKFYYLEVRLPDGSIYQSRPEQILPPVPIQGLTFDVTQETTIEESSGSYLDLKSYFFNVRVQTADVPNERNYFLWRALGTFEYVTLPVGDAPCTYCYCWAPVYPMLSYIPVMSDRDVQDGILEKKVGAFKYDRNTPFYTKVFQYSLTPEAYRFWNSVSVQQTNVGTIFDPAPEQIFGNIFNTSNSNEVVLGYFTAAGISEKGLLVHRGREAQQRNIKEPNLIVPEIGDCRLLYKGATHIKPSEFNE